MTRKTEYRLLAYPRIALALSNAVLAIPLSVLDGDWRCALCCLIVAYWAFDSYISLRKAHRENEASIALFNGMHPEARIRDNDFARFYAFEDGDSVRIKVTVYH